ncbi:MAG: rRNA pseudouridine synthase [Lachnospiraceae bacterium]|nr:rRNA pseudouridine synthase [Lachnospiraceae bacterium]
MRLNKYIASAGVCSRREADRLIQEGRVRVNGRPATAGEQVSEEDTVTLDDDRLTLPDETTVVAYYKPRGVTTTFRDEHAEKTITDVLKTGKRLTYAGRLDRESEGLLIMTDDGELIHELTSPRGFHEKEYVVTLDRDVSEEHIRKLEKGVRLEGSSHPTRPCSIKKINSNTVKIILTEGINRQIRRMFKTCEYNVEKLVRIRVMNVKLADLAPGDYRFILGNEKEELYEGCGLKARKTEDIL